jgi:hypothetical protein
MTCIACNHFSYSPFLELAYGESIVHHNSFDSRAPIYPAAIAIDAEETLRKYSQPELRMWN